jgi:hypothetical protein
MALQVPYILRIPGNMRVKIAGPDSFKLDHADTMSMESAAAAHLPFPWMAEHMLGYFPGRDVPCTGVGLTQTVCIHKY